MDLQPKRAIRAFSPPTTSVTGGSTKEADRKVAGSFRSRVAEVWSAMTQGKTGYWFRSL